MSDFKRLATAIDDFITEEQLKTLRETEWSHGTFGEFAQAIQQAAAKRLHPMRGHVYPRDQWLKDEKRERLLLGVKVDGQRTRRFARRCAAAHPPSRQVGAFRASRL